MQISKLNQFKAKNISQYLGNLGNRKQRYEILKHNSNSLILKTRFIATILKVHHVKSSNVKTTCVQIRQLLVKMRGPCTKNVRTAKCIRTQAHVRINTCTHAQAHAHTKVHTNTHSKACGIVGKSEGVKI